MGTKEQETVNNQQAETAEQANAEAVNETAQTEAQTETATSATDDAQARQLQEMTDKYMRLAAEYDNYRRRTIKEKADLIKTAGEGVLIKLLPVIDDFERAMQSTANATDIEAVKEGINLIYSKFTSFVEQNGVKEMPALNEVFDVDKHEALTNIPAPSEDMKGKVIDVIQKGYTLNDKVIRYAKVVVAE